MLISWGMSSILFDTALRYRMLGVKYIIMYRKRWRVSLGSSRRSLKILLTNAYKSRSDPKKVSCPKTVAVGGKNRGLGP